ncbi:hypothetical protein ACFOY2_04950 [Nonomuraea purpurea]|uniref:LapA family protein n=1 Tax=Nonomuraea purpurea TaxID=1849276 RepID=A0ABV8FXT3_9ACTN
MMFELLKNVLAVIGLLSVAAFGALVGWVLIDGLNDWWARRDRRRRELAAQKQQLDTDITAFELLTSRDVAGGDDAL